MQHSCSHSNAICNQSFKNRLELRTQEQPLVAKDVEGTSKETQPQHRRGTFLRRLQRLYTEKNTVSCSSFLPKTLPKKHSCSYSNAIMQPEILESHRTTHTGTTTRCKTHRRNNSRMTRPQPHPPHRRATFFRRLQQLNTKSTRFRAPASSPKHSPCNIHAAIPMRSCNQRFNQEPHRSTHTGKPSRCKTHRRNNSRLKRPQPHPPHRRGTFLRWLQPLYTENTSFLAPVSSQI